MKYYTGIITEAEEGCKVIYCDDLNEWARETKGNFLCSEEDPLEEMFGTDEKEEIFNLAYMEPMTTNDLIEISSKGIKDWIEAKEGKGWYLKLLRNLSGMTQKAIADMFNIPLRTWQDWEAGKRTPPEYVIKRPIRALEDLKPNQKYVNAVVDDTGKADIWTTVCKTRAEAVREAERQWGYLTKPERKGRRIIAGMILEETDEWGDKAYTDAFEEYIEFTE